MGLFDSVWPYQPRPPGGVPLSLQSTSTTGHLETFGSYSPKLSGSPGLSSFLSMPLDTQGHSEGKLILLSQPFGGYAVHRLLL